MKKLNLLLCTFCTLLLTCFSAKADEITENFDSGWSNTGDYITTGHPDSWAIANETKSGQSLKFYSSEGQKDAYVGPYISRYVDLVTEFKSGELSLYVKGNASATAATVEIYKVSGTLSNPTVGDKLATLVSSSDGIYNNSSWTQKSVKIDYSGLIAIRLFRANIDTYCNTYTGVSTYSVSGTVLDLDGNTVDGATVSDGTTSTTTSNGGKYVLESVMAGTANLVVTPTDELLAKGYVATTFTESVTDDVTDLTLTLRYAKSTLSGTIRDSYDQGNVTLDKISKVEIYADGAYLCDADTKQSTYSVSSFGTTTSVKQVEYSFEVVGNIADKYTIKVVSTDYDTAEATTSLTKDGETTCDFTLYNRQFDPADGSYVKSFTSLTQTKSNGQILNTKVEEITLTNGTKSIKGTPDADNSTSKIVWNFENADTLPFGEYSVTIPEISNSGYPDPERTLHYTIGVPYTFGSAFAYNTDKDVAFQLNVNSGATLSINPDCTETPTATANGRTYKLEYKNTPVTVKYFADGSTVATSVTISNYLAIVGQMASSQAVVAKTETAQPAGDYVLSIPEDYLLVNGKTYPAENITIPESISVSVETGVDAIAADAAEMVDVYTASGVKVASGVDAAALEQLPAGLYIVRSASKTYKFIRK